MYLHFIVGKDILPYLPDLMSHLLATIGGEAPTRAKELALSAIGATTNAAEKEILPYFPSIMEHIKHFLAPSQTEDQLKLQVQATGQ